MKNGEIRKLSFAELPVERILVFYVIVFIAGCASTLTAEGQE